MSQKRSIFVDVDSREQAAPVEPSGPKRRPDRGRGAVRIWLGLLLVLVVAMVAVGGLTRLTDSGLSITEWAPITGAIPPLSGADWLAEFDRYKAIPEYQLQNSTMTLEEFKVIYWWEWGHRQLGRFIGLVWAVGFLFLLVRGMPVGWWPRLLLLGVLGGAQGAIGWWMVASGLGEGMVDVSSYRLATHLGLAFLIIGLIVWYRFLLARPQMELIQARRRREGGRAAWGGLLAVLVFGQILVGALVAGIDAGLSFTDWPLMAGGFVPPIPMDLQPMWRNFFEDAGLVQFIHRMWAYALLLVALAAWWAARGSAVMAVRRGFDWALVAILGQAVLGVATLLYLVPWQLAILHQFGAVVVLSVVLRARFQALYPPQERIARG